jgi:uncharacterized protein
MNPTAAGERIEALDVVRGAALFGILASNMRAFNSPMAAYLDHSLMWQGAPDRMAQILIDVFISGKFITIFSFLFGIGFAVMMERAEARCLPNRAFYLRRLGVLLGFGLFHLTLLWWGDVLAPYALMGFLLFLFRNASQRRLLIWACFLYSWPVVLSLAGAGATLAGVQIPSPPPTTAAQLAETVRAYSSGTFPEIFKERMKENTFMLFGIFFFYPRILGLFLFGLLVWRRGIVCNLSERREMLRKGRFWGLVGGLSLNILGVAVTEIFHPDPLGFSPLTLSVNLILSAGVPLLSLFYVCSIALLLEDSAWHERLRSFAAVGRTALTNYLLHTVICTALYYSWGFGLYGKVGPLAGLLPTVLIYAALLWISNWWLRRHAYGPMEWLWRSLTYLHKL